MNEHKAKANYEKVRQLLDEHNICAELSVEHTGLVQILIEWGDWKHEHRYLDILIEENFNVVCANVDITAEDGSDCYSANHIYLIDFDEVLER